MRRRFGKSGRRDSPYHRNRQAERDSQPAAQRSVNGTRLARGHTNGACHRLRSVRQWRIPGKTTPGQEHLDRRRDSDLAGGRRPRGESRPRDDAAGRISGDFDAPIGRRLRHGKVVRDMGEGLIAGKKRKHHAGQTLVAATPRRSSRAYGSGSTPRAISATTGGARSAGWAGSTIRVARNVAPAWNPRGNACAHRRRRISRDEWVARERILQAAPSHVQSRHGPEWVTRIRMATARGSNASATRSARRWQDLKF